MNVQLSDEQRMLQDSAAKFCQNEINSEKVRALADAPAGITNDLWQKIAEQGWLGIMVPEEDGGLGLGVQELGVVCEELGRAIVPGPFLSTALAGYAIALGGTDAAKAKWLERIVGGETKAAVALFDQSIELHPDAIDTAAEEKDGGYVLHGVKYLVPDAQAADVLIVAARTLTDVSLFIVERSAAGVEVKPNKLTDLTSRSGQLYLKNVKVDADALIGELGNGWDIIEKLLDVANVCIAAGSVAGAEHILKLTINYAKERTQFGTLIGSFQAVKHPLVDVYCLNESARSAYHYAAWAVDADSHDKRSAVAVARLTATEAYRKATLDCLQAHGGIAFTWEYDLHLYLKRAKHNQVLYGLPSDYEETICKETLHI